MASTELSRRSTPEPVEGLIAYRAPHQDIGGGGEGEEENEVLFAYPKEVCKLPPANPDISIGKNKELNKKRLTI